MSTYDVVVEDVGGAFEVGDGAGDFEDAVEQRARNLAHVVGALVLVADAFLLGVTVVTAGARIHRGHEHERCGIFGRIFRP